MADAVTAPSAFLAEVIGRRIGVPAEVIPNVVPLDVFHYRTRNPVQPKMLVTRHLEKLYDIESVMRAFREVQQFYPEASLWIAGTGSQEEYLRGLVSAWYLKNVRFLGYVPFKDLSAIYDQCDILINASRADNFPGSLLEGAAAGLVVISTGVGGIPHVFEHGKNALLVDPGDWEGLASSVVRVIETPELGPRLAQEALRQCLRYDWSAVRLSLYQIYGFSPPGIAERNACRQDHLAATEPHMQRFESRDR
jgi:glycosyltransferase involved in cell wall biosynthesis